jgi:hypothetical protein
LGEISGVENIKLPTKNAPKTKKETGICPIPRYRFSFQDERGKRRKIPGIHIQMSLTEANLAKPGCSCEAINTSMGQTKKNPIQMKK